MSEKKQMNRRDFLKKGAITAAGATLYGIDAAAMAAGGGTRSISGQEAPPPVPWTPKDGEPAPVQEGRESGQDPTAVAPQKVETDVTKQVETEVGDTDASRAITAEELQKILDEREAVHRAEMAQMQAQIDQLLTKKEENSNITAETETPIIPKTATVREEEVVKKVQTPAATAEDKTTPIADEEPKKPLGETATKVPVVTKEPTSTVETPKTPEATPQSPIDLVVMVEDDTGQDGQYSNPMEKKLKEKLPSVDFIHIGLAELQNLPAGDLDSLIESLAARLPADVPMGSRIVFVMDYRIRLKGRDMDIGAQAVTAIRETLDKRYGRALEHHYVGYAQGRSDDFTRVNADYVEKTNDPTKIAEVVSGFFPERD